MRSKKGAGAIIGYVLLIGFAVGLATTIFIWMTQQTEELTESSVKFVEGGMQCDNVMINVAVVDDDDCSPSSSCCLKVSNTRYLNIEKVIVRNLDGIQSAECSDNNHPINATKYVHCGQAWPEDVKIEIMPIIKINGELFGCQNKATQTKC